MNSYHVVFALTSTCLDNPEGLSGTFVACECKKPSVISSVFMLKGSWFQSTLNLGSH